MDKNNGSTYFVGKRELLDRKRKYLERSKRERETTIREKKEKIQTEKETTKLPAKRSQKDWIKKRTR